MLKSIILTGCRVNMYNEMRALEKESHELEREDERLFPNDYVCFRMVRGGRCG